MDNTFVRDVFRTVYGILTPEASVPGVENLFEEGKEGFETYLKVKEAYLRVCDRLNLEAEFGLPPEDTDLNKMLFGMDTICELVGYAMFHYGMEYQKGTLPMGYQPFSED